MDRDAKILEWDGPPGREEPPGGARVWARDEYLFDRSEMKVRVKRFADPPLATFRTTYQVAPVRRGLGTLVSVTDLQCPSPKSPNEFASKDSQAELATETSQRVQEFLVGVNAYLISLHRAHSSETDRHHPGATVAPNVRAP